MPRNEGKQWKESPTEIFRMIFLLYTGMPPPIPTTSFYGCIIVRWHYGTNSYWYLWLSKGASVAVKQLSILLMYVQNQNLLKIFHIFKNGTKTPKIANHYSHKDLFTLRHSVWRKRQKPAQSDQIWLLFILWRCFIRQPLVQDNHFWVVSRVVVLYSFDCRSN